MKKPILAAILNIMPGIGYIYVGTRKKFGILLLASTAFCFAELFIYEEVLLAYLSMPTTAFGIIGCIILEAAIMYDAYQDAKATNRIRKK